MAICNGRTATAKLLLKHGANAGPWLSWNSERTTTALHTAARCNDATMVRLLLESKLASVDDLDSEDNTALHLASLHHEHFAAMRQLLESGADTEEINEDNMTPFALACEKGYFKAALLLLNRGVNYQSLLEPAEPIHLAAMPMRHFFSRTPPSDPDAWEDDREAFLRRILDPEFGYGVDDEGGCYRSALHAAAYKASLPRTIQCFLDAGANVNLKDEIGRTPLLRAFECEDSRVITAKIVPLLRHGARLDMLCTPIHYLGYESTCAFELALEMARFQKDYSMINFIFHHATSANFGQGYLSAVVLKSLSEDRIAECRTLMSHGATLKVQDEQLWKMVESSVRSRNVAAIQFYLDMLSDRVTPRKMMEMIFDIFKVYNSHFEETDLAVIEMLLERQDLDPSDYATETSSLLHLACQSHYPLDIIQKILDMGCNVNLFDSKLATPLHHAVNASCPRTFKLLLLYNASPFTEPSNEEWRIYLDRVEEEKQKAKREGCWDWDLYPANRPLGREEYETAFDAAVRLSWYAVASHFEYSSCERGPEKLHPVEMILERHDLPALPSDPMALSYVHKALNNRKSLRLLLKKGADPNSGSHCKRPPLLHAVQTAPGDWYIVIDMLLKMGADVRQTDENGRSFLDFFREATRTMAENIDVDAEFEDRAVKIQSRLTRYWRIATNDVSGQERIELRPDDDFQLQQEDHARRREAYTQRVREEHEKQEKERVKEQARHEERRREKQTRYEESFSE